MYIIAVQYMEQLNIDHSVYRTAVQYMVKYNLQNCM